MKQFIIKEDLLMAIGNYLLTRPMGEVRNLVQEMEKSLVLHEPEKTSPLEVVKE